MLTPTQKARLAKLINLSNKKGYFIEAQILKSHENLIGKPDVEIAPGLRDEISTAIDRIKKQVDPKYFSDVQRIDILIGGPFGQVTSDDPHTIKINLPKIKQEVKRQLDQYFKQSNVQFQSSNPQHQKIFDEVLTRALIEVVSHEKGHVEDFSPQYGPQGEFLGGTFPGGEGVAEQEAQQVKNVTDARNPLPV